MSSISVVKSLSARLRMMLVSTFLDEQYNNYEEYFEKIKCPLKYSHFNCFDPYSDNYNDFHDFYVTDNISDGVIDCYFARRSIFICSNIELFLYKLKKLVNIISPSFSEDIASIQMEINEFCEKYDPSFNHFYGSCTDNDVIDLTENIIRDKLFIVSVLPQKEKKVNDTDSIEIVECCICMDERNGKYSCETNCKHKFCIDCVCKYVQSSGQAGKKNLSCPMCRGNIDFISCNGYSQKKNISFFRDTYFTETNNEKYDEEGEEEHVRINVERIYYNGLHYYRDIVNDNVYNETGDEIGQFINSAILFHNNEDDDDAFNDEYGELLSEELGNIDPIYFVDNGIRYRRDINDNVYNIETGQQVGTFVSGGRIRFYDNINI
jgi:hypothetical protein